MGNYASTAELIARFTDEIEVAHLASSADTGSADTAVLNEVIGGAEGEINSYVARKFKVPLDVASDADFAAYIKTITLDLAVARLHSRSGNTPEPVRIDREHVIEWLVRVQKGDVELPSPRTEPSTVSRDPPSTWGTGNTQSDDRNSKRVFSRGSMGSL